MIPIYFTCGYFRMIKNHQTVIFKINFLCKISFLDNFNLWKTYNWIIFRKFLQLIFTDIHWHQLQKSNGKLVNQKLCYTFLILNALYFKLLSNNMYLVGFASLCSRSEVILSQMYLNSEETFMVQISASAFCLFLSN